MNEFKKLSKYAGMREDLVQAGGGNSSFKLSDEQMLIKASGFQLAEIEEHDGFSIVNQQIIRDAFLRSDINSISEAVGRQILNASFIKGRKPSIETFFHAISCRYTLHTHPIVVNALTCRIGGSDVLKQIFPDSIIIPYSKPGVELAKLYCKEIRKIAGNSKKIPNITFLQNHGMIISGETADEVIKRTENVIRQIEIYLDVDFTAYHGVTDIWRYFPTKIVWLVTDEHVMDYYRDSGGCWNHALCPDCVVFLGKKMLSGFENITENEISDFCNNYGEPVVVEYKGHLYIIAESVKKALEAQSVLSLSAQIKTINKNQQLRYLNDEEQEALFAWDAEKYRQTIQK